MEATRIPSVVVRNLRQFSSSAICQAPKASKGRAPPKKAAKQSFGKKIKAKEASSTSTSSAFAAKIGSGKASAKLNAAARHVELESTTPANCTAENIGRVFETPAKVVSQLYALDVLERQGGYQHFAQLATVLRQPSVEVANLLLSDGSSVNRRVLLDGAPGSGKSVVMLQAITLALQRKWVVMSVPRAEALVDSTYPYAYDRTRGSWRQDTYTAGLLGHIAEANKDVLQLQNTSKSFSFDRHTVPERSTLHKLLEIGSKDPAVSHNVLDAFMSEMNLTGRPALLLTLDNFTITTLPSRYRDPEFQAVHPFDLEIIKMFISYLDGSKSLTNGVVMTNTSSRPSAVARSLQLALKHDVQSPFETIDERIAASLQGVRIVQIDQYDQAEAKSIIQHYASAGLIRGLEAPDISDSLVKQRLMMGGSLGREVFRACLKQI